MKKRLYNHRTFYLFSSIILLIICSSLLYIYPPYQSSQIQQNTIAILQNADTINIVRNLEITNEIFKYTNAYRNSRNKAIENNALKINDNVAALCTKVDSLKIALVRDISVHKSFFYNIHSTLPTKNIITTDKIDEIKKLTSAIIDTTLTNGIRESDLQDIQYNLSKLNNVVLVQETSSMSAGTTINHLEMIKSYTRKINIIYLQALWYQVAADIKFDKFLLTVSPQQATVRVGEPFKAQIVLSNYVSKLSKAYHISCNDSELPIEEGIALYEQVFYKSGKHIITFKGLYNNPLTGQVDSYKKDYTIDILPK